MRGSLLFFTLLFASAICALAWAEQNRTATERENDSGSASSTSLATHPPEVRQQVVEENLHGVTIRDPYRYLEDANNPDTQRYVHDELAYTRSMLDPLHGRAQIHARLQQLLNTGSVGVAQIGQRDPKAQNYYFYTRRKAGQNQPVSYVREGLSGQDREIGRASCRERV